MPDQTSQVSPALKPGIWDKTLTGSLIVIFILMTLMSFRYGISGDEVDMNAYGKSILNYFTTFGQDKTALDPPKTMDRDGVLEYYGGGFDLLAAMINKISPLEEYTTRHILNAWAGFVAIFFAVKISRRIGNARMGLLCAWLMFLAPFFLGHAMNNPKDIPFAATYIAAIYYFIRFYDKLPGVKWKDYIAPVISLALAIDIRVAGILLIPYMAVYFVINYLLNKSANPDVPKFVKSFVLISVLGYLGACLLWPYALQNPFSNPLTALSKLSDFQVSLRQLYEGERIFSSELPSSYLIKNFFMTNSYILLAGLLLSPIVILLNIRKKESALIIFVAFVTFFPLMYIIYKHSNVYHVWRHVLFIFPGAAILAAYGLYGIFQRLKYPAIRYTLTALIVLGLAEPLYFIVGTYPNTITYYNAFAGGMEEAYDNYEMDYYFNSMKDACDWFIDKELPQIKGSDSIIIATNVSHIVGIYFKDQPKVKVVYVRFYERSMSNWDYAIFHRALIPEDQLQNRAWLIPQTLHESSVKDLPLTIVVKRPSKDDFNGFELLKQNRIPESIAMFQQYRSKDPKNEEVNTLLARYYMGVGNVDSAAFMIKEALMVSPNDMQANQLNSQLSLLKQRGNIR